jgi:hypothetical protein
MVCRRCHWGVTDPGNEAVNLRITIYNMRQGEGIRFETLFRDETVAALDTVNGKEYVRMLRRAMDLGGLHQVIFICHRPLVSELADRILSVSEGCGYIRHFWGQTAFASARGNETVQRGPEFLIRGLGGPLVVTFLGAMMEVVTIKVVVTPVRYPKAQA